MFDLDSFKKERLTSGVWKDFNGASLRISSIRTHAFRDAYAFEQKPYKTKIENGTLPSKVSQELLCRAMARHVLTDWKNVSSKGAEVPYSVEAAFNALNNNDELLDFVQSVAVDLGQFTEEQESADLKS